MKSRMLAFIAIVAATISAPSFAEDLVVWSCKINDADTYFKLVKDENDDRAIVTPFGQRLPAVSGHRGVDLLWVHRDGDTKFTIVIYPTFKAHFYDFTDVDEGESAFPKYRMKCEKEAGLKANLQSEEKRRAEEKRKAKEELQREEAELRTKLQAEENQRRLNSLREAHKLAILQKVKRNWIRPAGREKTPECWVEVLQGAGGIILDVTFDACKGSTAAYRASIEDAIYKAEPLPKPGDPSLFERQLNFNFKPE